MRILLVSILLFLSATTFAQAEKDELFKSAYELLKRKPMQGKRIYHFPSSRDKRKVAYGSYPTVIILKMDNMPCLVPDVKGFNMPVLQLSPAGTMPVQ